MAKKQEINKSQAVRDYVKANPRAMTTEITAALNDQGIKITRNYVANIKTKINKEREGRKSRAAKPAVVPANVIAPEPEKVAKGNGTVSLDHVRAAARMVSALGGQVRVNELLDLIKDVGGAKKFRDLVDAISATDMDEIPF
jgi:hypothetical protein